MNRTQANDSRQTPPACKSRLRKLRGFLPVIFLLLATFVASAQTSFTEYQVKALFLFNFAKYVEWPAQSFATATNPIVIGVLGENRFKDDLNRAVEGKNISGRKLVIKYISAVDEIKNCHMLFISSSENARLDNILGETKALAILTVGESEQFTQKGGIINFTLKEGKVRLEIEPNAARQAKLQISSKLLSVAVVKGKTN